MIIFHDINETTYLPFFRNQQLSQYDIFSLLKDLRFRLSDLVDFKTQRHIGRIIFNIENTNVF